MAKKKDVSKAQIMDAAKALLEHRGIHGFSTRELADEVGISSASLHHHFATKGTLVAAVAARCRDGVNHRLAEIAREIEGYALRLRHFHEDEGVNAESMLIAMLAADFPTLPPQAQDEARQLFANVLGWLTRFASQARIEGELETEAMVEELASQEMALLIGRAMLSRTATGAETPAVVSKAAWAWQRVSG